MVCFSRHSILDFFVCVPLFVLRWQFSWKDAKNPVNFYLPFMQNLDHGVLLVVSCTEHDHRLCVHIFLDDIVVLKYTVCLRWSLHTNLHKLGFANTAGSSASLWPFFCFCFWVLKAFLLPFWRTRTLYQRSPEGPRRSKKMRPMVWLETTRKGHHQSDQDRTCPQGNTGKTDDRRDGAYVGFPERVDTILYWVEQTERYYSSFANNRELHVFPVTSWF